MPNLWIVFGIVMWMVVIAVSVYVGHAVLVIYPSIFRDEDE